MATSKAPLKSVARKARASKVEEPVRNRGTGAALVCDQLRADILNLKIAPGTLLDESELAAQFKLSRSPVREALIRLSAEGLIQMLPNRSPVVTPFDIAEVPSYFDAIELMYRATCRLAAIYRTDEELEAIVQAEKVLDDAISRGDISAQMKANRDFHSCIADAGGNPFFAGWLRNLMANGQRLMRLGMFFQPGPASTLDVNEHRAIIAAIRKRDPEAADEAGRRDVDTLRNKFLRELTVRQTSGMPLATLRKTR